MNMLLTNMLQLIHISHEYRIQYFTKNNNQKNQNESNMRPKLDNSFSLFCLVRK